MSRRDLSVKEGTSERCYRTRRGRTDEQRYAIISPYFDGRIQMNGFVCLILCLFVCLFLLLLVFLLLFFLCFIYFFSFTLLPLSIKRFETEKDDIDKNYRKYTHTHTHTQCRSFYCRKLLAIQS
jgi:hypothetical protein